MKRNANNESKQQFKSLKAALNAVKEAAERDTTGTGTRAYLANIGISVQILNAIKWQQLQEKECQKSKTGTYCPWYVLNCLAKFTKDEITAIQYKIDADEQYQQALSILHGNGEHREESYVREHASEIIQQEEARRVNARAKKIRTKKAEAEKAA